EAAATGRRAADRARRGHLPVGHRGATPDRRPRGPVVRRARLRAQRARRSGRAADARASLREVLLRAGGARRDRAGANPDGAGAARPRGRILLELGLRGERARRAPDPPLLAARGSAREARAALARVRLPWLDRAHRLARWHVGDARAGG